MDAAARAKDLFRVERLTIVFDGDRDAAPIANFSLDFHEGEITCILGTSGCGKTTLLKALGGFVSGDGSGGVLFRGRYLQGPTPDIVMIFQENNLFPWLTVRGNVAFALKFRRGEQDNRQAAVDSMLRAVGLSEAAGHYPHQLSGGMRQRTAIARGLITNPQVLLLDEPFSALDVGLRRRMQTLLRQLWVETQKTMVMVTHNIEEAIQVGHRLIVLGGRPVEILMDRDTHAPEMRDRYSEPFLQLQRELEAVIY